MTMVYFQAKITVEERVAWTWCLFFAFLVPEIGKYEGEGGKTHSPSNGYPKKT